jgi:hypothetical protein
MFTGIVVERCSSGQGKGRRMFTLIGRLVVARATVESHGWVGVVLPDSVPRSAEVEVRERDEPAQTGFMDLTNCSASEPSWLLGFKCRSLQPRVNDATYRAYVLGRSTDRGEDRPDVRR